MGVHFSGLVQIVQSLDTFNMSNQAAIGLLKGIYENSSINITISCDEVMLF